MSRRRDGTKKPKCRRNRPLSRQMMENLAALAKFIAWLFFFLLTKV